MRRACWSLLLAAAACLPAWGQPTGDLVDAWRAALGHDPTYRAAQQEQQAAQEAVALAVGARRPEVALSGSASYNTLDQRIGATSRSPQYTGTSAALQLRQPIVNRDLESREAQARLRAEQASAVLAVRQLELSERLVDAYVQLALSTGLQDLTRADLQRQLELVQAARRSLTAGEGTTTEVLEAASRADLLRSQLSAAEAARQNAAETLAAITGPAWQPGASSLAGRPPATPASALAADLDTLVGAHPQVLARRLAVDLARENINGARAPYRSRLDWSLSAGRTDSDVVNSINQVNKLASIGVQFNVPLYDGGRDDSATRQAVLLVGKAQAELDDAISDVQLRLRQGQRGLLSAEQRWDALQTAKESTSQLIAATSRSIAGGVRSRLDLLLAERQLAQVLREEQQALADHAKAWWRLATARGQAGEAQLQQLAPSFRTP